MIIAEYYRRFAEEEQGFSARQNVFVAFGPSAQEDEKPQGDEVVE